MNETTQDLEGQVALVTGATRGIGLAIARDLADRGARVVITGRKQEGMDRALAQFPEGTARGVLGRADDPVHQRETVESLVQTEGRLDVLVNNAGINPVYGPLADTELDVVRKVFEVNVLAGLAWVQQVLAEEGLGFRGHGGRVVFLSSVSGEIPSPGIGVYGISKAAVSHLARTLAVELAPEIRVNAVAPAVVKTDFAKALYEGHEAESSQDYPLGRLGVPEDVAGAVSWLVGPQSSWVTGQVLTLDGGLLVGGGDLG